MLLTPVPLLQTVTPSQTSSPLERDVFYGRPLIFWEVVFVWFARKHEQSKKGVIKELFSEIGVFLVKKGLYTTLQAEKIWKISKKIRK